VEAFQGVFNKCFLPDPAGIGNGWRLKLPAQGSSQGSILPTAPTAAAVGGRNSDALIDYVKTHFQGNDGEEGGGGCSSRPLDGSDYWAVAWQNPFATTTSTSS